MEASTKWNNINATSDVLGLLRLIRRSIYNRATSREATHSFIEAEEALMTFKQTKKMSNSDYLEKFKSLTEVYEHLGGQPGNNPERVHDFLEDPDADDPDDHANATRRAKDKYLAVRFILKSNKKRYGSLITDLINGFTQGRDGYPDNLNRAYDMLINYVTPHSQRRISDHDGGMAFITDAEEGGRGGRGGRGNRGGGRGGRGGRSGRGASSTNQEQIHAANNGDTNENSEDYNTLLAFDARRLDCFLQKDRNSLPKNWILLDSCSSVNIVFNRDLLRGIHRPGHTIGINCNAGTVTLKQQGKLGGYPAPVWYHPQGIANIMSMADVARHYRLTMDTGKENSITLHRPDGTTAVFTPSAKGLYKYEMREDKTVEGFWSFLETVDNLAANFTKREIQHATEARRLQNIVMRPGVKDLQQKVLHHLKNCPITATDIQVAEHIFGPNLGSLKGKTVRRPLPRSRTGVCGVPLDILQKHPSLEIAMDIMFINKIAFLVSVSRKLHFGTVEALPDRQTDTIKKEWHPS